MTEGVRYVPFDELLRESHIISLHTPLTAETLHLLDRDAFAQCRHGALIINTARGAVIDTDALIEALDAGIIGGSDSGRKTSRQDSLHRIYRA